MAWIDNNGLILVSNSSKFAFGFNPTKDVTFFLLVVIHVSSSTIVWSANRGSPVRYDDDFVFAESGNAYLESGKSTIWSTNTASKGVSVMELRDSGNLILLGKDGSTIWESFSHPVDSLLSGQNFTQGMKLVSSPNNNNLSYLLEFKSGDMLLSASFKPPQPYWAMGKDERRTINQVGGDVTSAILDGNSWKIYDQKEVLLWQFIFKDNQGANATRLAVLGEDGYITFSTLQDGSIVASQTRIPQDECSTPASCDPYFICSSGNRCQCPSALPSCKPDTASFCNKANYHVDLVDAGDSLGYFALSFVSPSAKTDLNGCKTSCLGNCSCTAMFFDSSSGNCFMFDQIGSLKGSINGAVFKSYIKVSASQVNGDSGGGGKGRLPIIFGIVICTGLIILGLIYGGIRYQRRKNKLPDSAKESSEEDNFLEGLSGMPIRFSYNELQNATNNFSIKLGQGRKNYDPSQSSEKSHFPSYAFKMMEEGNLKDLIDRNLKVEEEDERVSIAIRVALWCIQDDMSLRPSMAKVVQMLEGLCPVPSPPTASQMGTRHFSGFLKSLSGDATSSSTSGDAYLSAVRLSGPR
ncbi:hypothetical protein K7X08_016694 [Anisodus acutangulus]|uniref:Bulb-type lectin domain-containing protein n=1 Tax=Anisodus acutangulus TaxID=402998 RepID=A0A9Q1LI27_9SOLA|nr:hypothetical protein K7X08_016694 [Anisodus acutangulus]